jgi:hypothetical protein
LTSRYAIAPQLTQFSIVQFDVEPQNSPILFNSANANLDALQNAINANVSLPNVQQSSFNLIRYRQCLLDTRPGF